MNIEAWCKSDKPLWSICIPSLDKRKDTFDAIVAKLQNQIVANNAPVKIIYCIDNGKISIGLKRQALLDATDTKYISFVDDDDDVSETYISKIMDAIDAEDVDCISFLSYKTSNGVPWGKIRYSYSCGFHEHHIDRDRVFVRHLSHLCVLRTSIAKSQNFLDLRRTEDEVWIKRIIKSGLIKTNIHIDEVLYYYIFDIDKTATQHPSIPTVSDKNFLNESEGISEVQVITEPRRHVKPEKKKHGRHGRIGRKPGERKG